MSRERQQTSAAWRTMLAYGWRFALAGPPIGTGVIILPAMILSLSEPKDVLGAWLWFSIFGYLFALPIAALAGLFYGAAKHYAQHPSRWLLGGLCSGLAWEAQCWAVTLAWQDTGALHALLLLPVPTFAGAVCARLFAPAAARHAPPGSASPHHVPPGLADPDTRKP